jgi:hypothetical protein
VKAKPLGRPQYIAFQTELKSHIAAARPHAAILGQPVPDLCSRVRSTAGLAEGGGFLQQLVKEIPWGDHLLIPDKVKDPAALPERSGK